MLVTEIGINIVTKPELSNACWLIVVNFSGRFILIKLLQFWNAYIPILSSEFGSSMYNRLVHPLNALSPMLVTPFSIFTYTKSAQLLNNDEGMPVMFDGITILDIPISLNAALPIFVTLSGSTKLVMPTHPVKAFMPILVILVGNSNSVK